MAAKKRSLAEVPAGFTEVDNSLAGFWKPTEAGQRLQGTVGHLIEVKSSRGDGKMNRFFAVRITNAEISGPISTDGDKLIEPEEGALVGVGGAVLLSFLADQIGKEVYLVYKGLGRAKRGQNAPKLYATYAKEYDGETGEIVG